MQFDFSSDGEKIAFLENHLPVLIDIQTAQRVRTFSLEGLFPPDNQPPVLKVLFSPDGKRLAGYTDFGLVLWDVSTGKPLWKADWSTARNYGQQGIDLTTSVTFSPDGDLLVTTSIAADSDIRVWSAKTGKLIKEVGMGNQRDAVFSPDGKRLYTADRITETEAIRIWDTESWRQIGVVYVPGQAFSTVLSTNGETMVVGSMDTGYGPMRLEIYSVKGWKHIGTIEDLDPGGVGQKPIYTYPTLNRDGGIVAFATDEFVVQLWDVTNQKHIMSLEGKSPTPIWTVRFSPDGRLLAAQGENGKIIFWGVPSQ
jgi:WD40 repeat protein